VGWPSFRGNWHSDGLCPSHIGRKEGGCISPLNIFSQQHHSRTLKAATTVESMRRLPRTSPHYAMPRWPFKALGSASVTWTSAVLHDPERGCSYLIRCATATTPPRRPLFELSNSCSAVALRRKWQTNRQAQSRPVAMRAAARMLHAWLG
jgi:hypothetical protein